MDVSYYTSGDAKSRITVMHSKLTDAEDVEATSRLLESGAGAAERVSDGVGVGAFGASANVADFAKFPWHKNLGGGVNHQ